MDTMINHASSFLIKLPSEIRLLIYDLVLPYSTYESSLEANDCPVKWHRGTCPAILFVNRRIHEEAAEMLYGNNFFAVYVKQPNGARLPMNESRPDSESFILFSWDHGYWAHPRNKRMLLPDLFKHSNLPDISKLYLSFPCLGRLVGVDAYVRRSSDARFFGLSKWLQECSDRGGSLIPEELDRIRYVYKYKDAFDQIGKLIQALPQLDFLGLGMNVNVHILTFMGFMIEQILSQGNIGHCTCFFILSKNNTNFSNTITENMVLRDPLTHRFEQMLRSDKEVAVEPVACLSKEANDMYRLLQEVRVRQSLQSTNGKDHSFLNPLDIIGQ